MIGSLSQEQLDAPEPGNPARTVRYAILRGLHDEARHSGEISLLRKMMQNTFVVKSPSLALNHQETGFARPEGAAGSAAVSEPAAR